MGLSNYQLVLLDNLIYLDTIIEGKELKVENIIDKLLNENPSDQSGTVTIKQDAYSCYNGFSNCLMTEKEWVDVLSMNEKTSYKKSRGSTFCSSGFFKMVS